MADGLLYSDDFSALVIGKDLRTVCEVMQAALNRVKTEMVLFTRKEPSQD